MSQTAPLPIATDRKVLEPYTLEDIHDTLPMALSRTHETLLTYFRPLFARHDITTQQWRVLRIVALRGPLDASDLADRSNILAPSLTRILRAMEERELLTRTRDTHDGRRIWINVTPQGHHLIEKVLPKVEEVHRQIEAKFSDRNMEMLQETLLEMIRSIRRG